MPITTLNDGDSDLWQRMSKLPAPAPAGFPILNLTTRLSAITVTSITGSIVMEKSYEPTRKDHFLANYAAGCIAGSALLAIGVIFILVFVISPAPMLRDHRMGLFVMIAGAAAWGKSALNLGKLRRRSTTVEPRQLWRVSP